MKVKATENYKKLGVTDNQLGRVPEVGEEFEISEERYKLLTHNSFGVAFVEPILEKVVETAKAEPKVEKAVKKVVKKKKK